MPKQTVALYTVTTGDRAERARESLAEALGDATLGEPDDAGAFELKVDAKSPKAARELVREAFARAGTGDDFVIREGTKGREMPPDDPRQGQPPNRSTAVADAADAVAAAASTGAETAAEAATSAADTVREAADSAAGSARELAGEAAAAAPPESPLRRFAPIGGLLLLLFLVRRRRR